MLLLLSLAHKGSLKSDETEDEDDEDDDEGVFENADAVGDMLHRSL